MRSQALSKLKDPRERRFVEAYCESNNGTRAALVAGYGRNYGSANVYQGRLMQKARIKDAIDQRNAEIMQQLDLSPDRIVKRFARFAMHEPEKITDQAVLAALRELAKLARMYPAERLEHTGADGGPITAVTLNASQHKIDIEGMSHEEREQFRQTLMMLKTKAAISNQE